MAPVPWGSLEMEEWTNHIYPKTRANLARGHQIPSPTGQAADTTARS
jgi:hypothetical protein